MPVSADHQTLPESQDAFSNRAQTFVLLPREGQASDMRVTQQSASVSSDSIEFFDLIEPAVDSALLDSDLCKLKIRCVNIAESTVRDD